MVGMDARDGAAPGVPPLAVRCRFPPRRIDQMRGLPIGSLEA
jgi:hypothetical protein